MIDEDEVGLKENPEVHRYIKKITSKQDPKHPGVQAKDLIPTLLLLGLRTQESSGASRLKAHSTGTLTFRSTPWSIGYNKIYAKHMCTNNNFISMYLLYKVNTDEVVTEHYLFFFVFLHFNNKTLLF